MHRRGAAAAVVEALEVRALLSISLLGDLNTTTPLSNAFAPVVIGSVGYFSADDGVHGAELWRTDGTEAGTWMVKDINPGSASSGQLDGNQTVLKGMIAVGSTLYFQANDGTNGAELWKSDGTEAGTVMVKSIAAGSAGPAPQFLAEINGKVVFYGAAWGVYASDGTPEGTVQLKFLSSGGFAKLGSYLYFITTGAGDPANHLYRTDGTVAGTVDVMQFAASTPSSITSLNGKLYFAAQLSGSTGGIEPCASDGTAAGTVTLGDLYPGGNTSSPKNFVAMGTSVYFTASSTASTAAFANLYRTNGTAAGTTMVGGTFAAGISPSNLTVFNSAIYFSSTDSALGSELFRSDGVASVGVFADVNPGANGSSPTMFQVYNGRLYFGASTAAEGFEMRSTDGTSVTLLKDLAPGAGGVRPFTSTAPATAILNGKLLFRGGDFLHGQELFSTDGTGGGTVLVKDINASKSNDFITSSSPVPGVGPGPGGFYYFAASDGNNGTELWKTDGTLAGTSMVKDIYPGSGTSGGTGPNSSSPGAITYVNGALLFVATDAAGGSELWRSDGTTAGTAIVKDINPGASGGISVKSLVKVGNRVFFAANDGSGVGYELWVSDGTAAGTQLVKDLYPGVNSSMTSLTGIEYHDKLIFRCNDGVNANAIYVSDGTAAGTTVLASAFVASPAQTAPMWTPFNDRIYFTANTSSAGTELWVTDGTAAGTQQVADVYPGNFSASPNFLTATADALYFTALADATNGRELWRITTSSPTPVRLTTLVYDVQQITPCANGPGVLFTTAGSEIYRFDGTSVIAVKTSGFSVAPSFLTSANGLNFFSAGTSAAGTELWLSDGTAGGTVMVQDVVAGTASSSPQMFAVIGGGGGGGGGVMFTATTPTTGRELFVLSPFARLNGDGSLTLEGTQSSDWLALKKTGGNIEASLFGATLSFPQSAVTNGFHIVGGGANDAITFAGGSFSFDDDLGVEGGDLSVAVAADADVTFSTTQRLHALDVSGQLHVAPGGSNFILAGALLVRPGGSLDLADNAAIVDYDPGLSPIGSWNGSAYTGVSGMLASGLIASSVATAGYTTLGVAEASDVVGASGGSYRGHAVDSSAVIIKYTYAGDANLDGVISGDDYFQIDSSFPAGKHGWLNGDFNFDGAIDGDDYFLIDSNFPAQGAPL